MITKHRFQKGLIELFKTMKLAWPIVLAQFSHVVLHMVDAIMVGELGKNSLAAASFSIGLFAIPLVFMFGISSVLSSLVAKAIGEKAPQNVGRVFRHGLIVCALVGIASVLLIELILPHLEIFKQTPEVTVLSRPYLRYLGWSLLPLGIYMVYVKFCEGVSNPEPVTIISWLAVGFNVFLNWIFIFGKFGFSPQGLTGAGLATFLSRVLILVFICFHVHLAKKYKIYNPDFHFRNFSTSLVKKIFSLGWPSGVQHINEIIAFAGGGIMVGWIGATEQAAHMVGINLASSTFIVAMSVGFASTVRVGEAYGRQDPKEIYRIGITSFVFVVVLMAAFACGFMLFRKTLPYIYIDDPAVVTLAAKLLILAALFQVFDGLQSLGISLARGILDVKIPLWITVLVYWGVCLPLSYTFAFILNLGAEGIWWGYVVGLAIVALLLNWRFFYRVLQLKKLKEKSFDKSYPAKFVSD